MITVPIIITAVIIIISSRSGSSHNGSYSAIIFNILFLFLPIIIFSLFVLPHPRPLHVCITHPPTPPSVLRSLTCRSG